MQVNNISTIQYYNKINSNKCIEHIYDTSLPHNNNTIYNYGINFHGKINKEYFINILTKDPIKEFKTFSKEEYLKLTENQKNKLRAEYKQLEEENPYLYQSMGEIHAYAAECLKKTFDKRFGKNNYIVLPIGRSLSSIGKSLELKIGKEHVINIPLSGASQYFSPTPTKEAYEYYTNRLKNDKGLNDFLKFLEEKHISKKDIETSNKHYILIDYCVSGFSLKGAEQLFKSNLVCGNKKNNIHAVDFISLLNRFDESIINSSIKKDSTKTNIHSKLENILYESEYKPFAFIGNSYFLNETTNASKAIINSNAIPRDTKLAWFNLIDKIMTGKGNFDVKLKSNIQKEIDKNKYPKQNIEIWNTPKSQYLSDLRNDLNELSKIFIEIEKPNNTNKLASETQINKLNSYYKYLVSCYKNIQNTQDTTEFYQQRENIKKLINDMNN